MGIEPVNGKNEIPVSVSVLMLWVCLLFKSFRFMMHTSVLLLGTHNRSWYIHVCELFKIFCFSPRHFIDLKYILKLLPPLGSPLELFFMKYTSIRWPRLENVADGVKDILINMAAPSTLKEAHSDSSPGKFLNTDEWVFTCLSSPGIVKVHGLCCHLTNFVISESSIWRRHTYFHTNSVWN
jgi:hypothetical protein